MPHTRFEESGKSSEIMSRRERASTIMPYVNVRITKGAVTREQKAQVVREITQTLQRVLGKHPEHTHIIIDEVELENWGFAGILTDEFLKSEGKV